MGRQFDYIQRILLATEFGSTPRQLADMSLLAQGIGAFLQVNLNRFTSFAGYVNSEHGRRRLQAVPSSSRARHSYSMGRQWAAS